MPDEEPDKLSLAPAVRPALTEQPPIGLPMAVAAAVGDTAISGTAATGAGYLEARFRKLHVAFTAQRAGWLAGLLKQHLLGTLPEDLKRAAEIRQSAECRRVRELTHTIRELLRTAHRAHEVV